MFGIDEGKNLVDVRWEITTNTKDSLTDCDEVSISRSYTGYRLSAPLSSPDYLRPMTNSSSQGVTCIILIIDSDNCLRIFRIADVPPNIMTSVEILCPVGTQYIGYVPLL